MNWTLPCSLVLAGCMTAVSAAERRPNILFVVADDWGLHAGVYGTTWVKTPHVDRVAREGLLFTHAYTPNAKCAPSRSTIITGRNPWQLEAAVNHNPVFPMGFKTWSEALTGQGWLVGCTGKGWGPGVANDAQGRPRLLTGRFFNGRTTTPPTTGIDNVDYAANFNDFLDSAKPGESWSFWYGCREPHRAYEPGTGAAKGGKSISDIDRVPGYWPDNATVRNDMLDYAYEVEYFDRHLGLMLESLERRGELDDTLIIVTSDNGMPFPRVKGNSYESANHLPLMMRWPKGIRSPGRTIDDMVSFVDLAPTIIEAAGLTWEQTGMAQTAGRSLFSIFRSDASGQVDPSRDHVLLGKERNDVGRPQDAGYPSRSIIRNGWFYSENYAPSRWPAGNPETGYLDCDGGATKTFILQAHRQDAADPHWALCFGMRPAVEFYQLGSDPDSISNLAGRGEYAELQAGLKRDMEAELRSQGDPRMLGHGDMIDSYPYGNPAVIHFYERMMAGEKMSPYWVSPSDFEPRSVPTAPAP